METVKGIAMGLLVSDLSKAWVTISIDRQGSLLAVIPVLFKAELSFSRLYLRQILRSSFRPEILEDP
jgi:hypothetical protein